MSIDQYVMTTEDAAREALFATKALRWCEAHGTTIRVGDEEAERHAYARATVILKAAGNMWMREDVMAAIEHELSMAADDDECPSCEQIMRD